MVTLPSGFRSVFWQLRVVEAVQQGCERNAPLGSQLGHLDQSPPLPRPPVPVVSPAPEILTGGTQLAQLKMKVTGKRGARYPGRPATSPDELSLDELDETVENRTA